MCKNELSEMVIFQYLNQDHEVFKTNPQALEEAIILLISSSLQEAKWFRMEFEPKRLKKVIGDRDFHFLFGKFHLERKYDTFFAGPLNDETKGVLKKTLSFRIAPGYEDLPLNYIDNVSFFDASRKLVFNGSDMMNFLIFKFPEYLNRSFQEEWTKNNLPLESLESIKLTENDLKKLELGDAV